MNTQAVASPAAQDTAEKLCQDLAAEVLALRGIVARLLKASPDAAASATLMGLLEQIQRTATFGRFVATKDADLTEVNRFDPLTTQLIDELVANPRSLTAGSAQVPVATRCKGMAPHRPAARRAEHHHGHRRIAGS